MRLRFAAILLLAAGATAAGNGGEASPPAGQPVQRGTLDASIANPTSLAFGPDGRLYVASLTSILALTLDPETHDVTAQETISSGLDTVLGIAFDPTAPASPVVVYASNMDSAATPGFRGRISRFTAPVWDREDMITGLPDSAPYTNHFTNGIAFASTGLLFIAQGSQTDAGVTDPPGGAIFWAETPLSAAILVADISAAGFDGSITYSPSGSPATDDVDMTSGDVGVFASGVRNPYDLVLHSNGLIYTTDNAPTGGTYSASCTTTDSPSSTTDELNLIELGKYYGAPNRNRGRTETRQCTYHPGEEATGGEYTAPISLLPSHCSCNGITEYTSSATGVAQQADLVYAEFIPGNVTRAGLSAAGRAVETTSVIASNFQQPLDVTVGPDGTLYVAEHAGNRISFLDPDPTPRPGDANCDGEANSIDALLVLQLVAALIGSVGCPDTADADEDGDIDAVDAALILQYTAGLLPSLPAP